MRLLACVVVLSFVFSAAHASHEIVWLWDASEGANEYRILQAEQGQDFWVSHVVTTSGSPWWYECPSGRICTQFTAWPSAPGVVLFLVVLACNEVGCSPTEHGFQPGDGYAPTSPP